MSKCTKKNIVSIVSFSICILSNLVFANLTKSQPALDCNKVSPDDVVVTAQGVEPVKKYCDFQEKLPQVTTRDRVESQPTPPSRSKFGKPYNAKDSVCRDRGIDTICLSPNNASKLNELK
jgi:hypothetical protein